MTDLKANRSDMMLAVEGKGSFWIMLLSFFLLGSIATADFYLIYASILGY